MEHTGFPSEETLAAFIDGRLDTETRRRVVEHLAECSECYETFLGVGEWGREGERTSLAAPSPVTRWRRMPLVAGFASAAAVALFFLMPRMREWNERYTFGHRTGIASLVVAANTLEYRPNIGRLNGDFEYRMYKGPTRGPGDRSISLDSAASAVETRARQNPTVENLHALGVAQLLLRKRTAKETLEDALLKETGDGDVTHAIMHSSDAALLSDLSAAYLTSTLTDPQVLVAAANAAERSWTLKESPQAAWNRAIAADALHLPTAINAWNDYLRLDKESDWSEEARQRIQQLQKKTTDDEWRRARPMLESAAAAGDVFSTRRLVAAHGAAARSMVEDELFPLIASEKTPQAIQEARTIDDAIVSEFGDYSISETLSAILEGGLAGAVIEYGKARDYYLHSQGALALPLFRSAAKVLNARRVPLGARAEMFVATLEYYARDLVSAATEASHARSLAQATRCPSIEAQSLWIEGLVLGSQRSFIKANQALLGARDLFEKLHDRRSVAAIEMVIAGNYRFAGDNVAAWIHLHEALALKKELSAEKNYLLISEAAKTIDGLGLTAAVPPLLDYAVTLARSDRSAAETTDALLARAEFFRRSGDPDAAAADVRAASQAVAGVKDAITRKMLDTELDLVRGSVFAVQDPSESLAALERALPKVVAQGNIEKLTRGMFARGIALRAQGNSTAAADSLRATLEEFERQRVLVDEDTTRVALVDDGRSAADALVALLIENGQSDEALLWSERSKARVLLDSLRLRGRVPTDAMSLRDLTRGADPAATYVEFQVLPKLLATWTISAQGISFSAYPIGERELDSRVRSLCSAMYLNDRNAVVRSSGALYDILIRPVKEKLGPRVVFIADKSLQRVPWPALLDRTTDQLLGTHTTTSVAPTISWCNARRQPRTVDRNTRFLFVSGGATSDLEPLPFADADADAMASLFDHSLVLRGRVSVEEFGEAAQRAEAINFAGHAITDEAAADRSALLIGEDARPLRAEAIARLDLSRLRVVTLAACATAGGRLTSDGAMSISRAFLLAGAPVVVSSIAPVEDGLASALSQAFYRNLLSGDSPAVAMQNAERTVCTADHSGPECWAAFQVYGLDS